MANQSTTSMLVLVGRIFWMILGPIILAVLTIVIISSGDGWLTPKDIAFFAVLIGMPLGRWLEFQGGSPETSTGEPATAADLHRYVLTTIVLGTGVWMAANVAGNHLLPH